MEIFHSISRGQFLKIKPVNRNVIHCSAYQQGLEPMIEDTMYTSPMVYNTGESVDYQRDQNTLIIGDYTLHVREDELSLHITGKTGSVDKEIIPKLTILPADYKDMRGLEIDAYNIENVYGLGQEFKQAATADGDWISHRERCGTAKVSMNAWGGKEGNLLGNKLAVFKPDLNSSIAGMVGNIQIPVLYALGDDIVYGLFLDNVYKQDWFFYNRKIHVRMFGDHTRFFIILGESLGHIRKSYLDLTGKPPVPPKKVFGLWVSEFGYENWNEIKELKNSLRSEHYPVDGFILDLFWFGGIVPKRFKHDTFEVYILPKLQGENAATVANSYTRGEDFYTLKAVVANDSQKLEQILEILDSIKVTSQMGKLNWDIEVGDGNDYCFIHPGKNIEELAADSVALAAIEESYITEHTKFYNEQDDYFARGWDDKAVILKRRWFGREAKMIDWSNEEAGAFIFKEGRFPSLVNKGIHFHWTDLGEPEHFEGDARYKGFEQLKNGEVKNRHPDIHNLYNFMWNKSIYDGYCHCTEIEDDGKKIRHFILTRSGAAGTQRLGTAVWSGDIASDPKVLATHLNAQLHMSLCGIDYYGSDVGGFRRENIDMNNEDEMYTQWFANSAWFDVPLRPHVDNAFVEGGYHTAPNKVGHRPSNLYNLRRRYELIPYYYSLAFRAFLTGEPVIPPLVYYFPGDKKVRTTGHEKLVGPFILVGVVAAYGETSRNVYLPAGTPWVNAHTGQWFDGGREISKFPVYFNGNLTLPVFYRQGAIIPEMHVDEQTMDVFGRRKDGSVVNDLIVTVAPGRESTSFTLYEDDGRRVKYNNKVPEYDYRTTVLAQQWVGDKITVTIGRTEGTFRDTIKNRKIILKLMLNGKEVTGVWLNGEDGQVELEQQSNGVVVVTSKSLALDKTKKFEIKVRDRVVHTGAVTIIYTNSGTRYGENIYIVGNIPELGNGTPVESNRLNPVYYKNMGHNNATWMKYISGLPLNSSIEWKLVRKLVDGRVVDETGERLLKPDTPGFNGSIEINKSR